MIVGIIEHNSESPKFDSPMQSVSITTNVVSSNPTQERCIWYNIMWEFVSDLPQVGGFLHQ
jgi:hypothetical protein